MSWINCWSFRSDKIFVGSRRWFFRSHIPTCSYLYVFYTKLPHTSSRWQSSEVSQVKWLWENVRSHPTAICLDYSDYFFFISSTFMYSVVVTPGNNQFGNLWTYMHLRNSQCLRNSSKMCFLIQLPQMATEILECIWKKKILSDIILLFQLLHWFSWKEWYFISMRKNVHTNHSVLHNTYLESVACPLGTIDRSKVKLHSFSNTLEFSLFL